MRIAYFRPTTGFSPEEDARREAIIRRLVPDDVEIRTVLNPGGPRHVVSPEGFPSAIAAAQIALKGLDAAEFGVAVMAAALDPGLAVLRQACPVPLVGPGEASLFIAAVLGRPLSVVTIDEFAVAAVEALLEQTPMKPPIASVRSMETPARTFVNDHAVGIEALRRECQAAVREDGAQAIYLGSMSLTTLGITDELQDSLGVPVLDPLRISMAAAVQCLYAQTVPRRPSEVRPAGNA